MNKFPNLVLPQFCKTPITLLLNKEEVSEDGEPIQALKIETFCNFQGSAKRIYTDKETFIQVNAVCLFCGDIAPELAEISNGIAIVNDVKRNIITGRKSRNPDNSVNFCEVDLE